MQLWQGVRRRTDHALRGLRSDRPFTRRRDFVLLAVLLAPWAVSVSGPAASPAVWAPVALLIAAAVAVRRSWPLLSLTSAALTVLLHPVLHATLWTAAAAAVLSFLAGTRVTRIWHAQAVFVSAALVGLLLVSAFAQPKDWLSLLMMELAACLLPWWAGNWWRQRSDLTRAGWEHAEQLEWKQRFVAEQARLKERARIAQDIHDSLGHELSVMALLAGGLELATSLPAEQRDAMAQLRERCTTATERLHDVIGLLREDSTPSLRPPHESVAELVRRFERSGTPVELREEGANSRSTPLLTSLAAYRVVQESLTNAAKHSPGAAVRVQLTHRADETVVSVDNDPPRDDTSTGAPGSGLGLIGLDERVRLAGGTLRAGRRGGGFEVRAELPHTLPAMPSAPAGGTEGSDDPKGPAGREDPAGAKATPDDAAPGGRGSRPLTGMPRWSASTAALMRARARVRRDGRRAALMPVVLGGGLVLCLAGLYILTAVTTSLTPETYARIRLGQSREELAPVLPDRRIKKPPPIVIEPAVPPGSACEYYRAGKNVLRPTNALYRLCFKDDVLVAKDTL
ncbi:histidine kinase [Streptomyces sp. 150FB]|uniref:sensor histidine kinase n=1 Tax=Streptomyces sp. 150FB TaxID=1576605 RepID=UPI0005896D70|nr:histidine kinase [Streptomyces sp. 150FB]KIF77577.1 histidine kinase [Streptomyces sp. 150FB]